MSVPSLSSINTTSATDPSSVFADRRKNMQALNTALQGGDLQAAQSAFAAMQQSAPAQSGATTTPGSFASGLQAVGQALQSGDLAGAQKAFAALQQKAHGHHHHHSGASSAPAQAAPTTSPAADAGANNTSTGLLLNLVG